MVTDEVTGSAKEAIDRLELVGFPDYIIRELRQIWNKMYSSREEDIEQDN